MTESAGINVQWVPHGPPALAALAAAIDAAKDGDPLRTVTVVAPTKVAGLTLRRTLASRPGGILGVRFQVLAQVAEALAAPAMAGSDRTPLTPAIRRELVRLALRATPGAMADVAAHPATVDAVDRAAQQVRAATAVTGDSALLAALDRAPGIPQALAGVIRTVDGRRGRWYDEHDLALAAAQVATGGGANGGAGLDEAVGPVVIHLPSHFTDAEVALVRALGTRVPVTVLAGHTGDRAADDRTATLVRTLRGPPPPDGTLDLDGLDVIVTVDPDEEVREAARLVAAAMHDGCDLARMAVLYRSPDYATTVHEVFEASDLPHNGPATTTLGQTIAGRFLSQAWAWAGDGLPRVGLLDLLGALPVRTDRGPVPAGAWADIARDARVIGGRDHWDRRLAGYADDAAENAARPGTDEWLRTRLAGQAEHARTLRTFALDLAEMLAPPREATWAGWSAWALRLLDTYLGRSRRHWPAPDVEAEGQLRQRLVALAHLDEIRAAARMGTDEVTEADARQVIDAELATPMGRTGRAGVGVHVGPLGTAGAVDLDHVIILGAVEGDLPPRLRPDALLPDLLVRPLRDDAATVDSAGHLDTVDDRVARVRQALGRVMASTDRTTFTVPRANRREQRAALPAPWLLKFLEHRRGHHVSVEDVLDPPWDLPWVRSVASAVAGLRDAAVPAGVREASLRALAEHVDAGGDLRDDPLVQDRPTLRHAADVVSARLGPAFTGYDGLVDGQRDLLVDRLTRPQSANRLATYSTCPRSWFFDRVLYVRTSEEPRRWLGLDALDRGNLVHGVLEDLIAEEVAGTGGGGVSAPPGSIDRMRELFDTRCAELEATGRTGVPQLWAMERRELWRNLLQWHARDQALRDSLGVAPAHTELAFGMGDPDGVDVLAVPTASEVTLHLRGRIDRIDTTSDGTAVVVTDYKTGKPGRYATLADDIAQQGAELQLPVYGMVAAREYPDAQVHVGYWHVHEKATRNEPVLVEVDDDARERSQQVFDAIAASVLAGVFPAVPGKETQFPRPSHEHCRYCPFDRICPSHGERIREFQRVAATPQVGALLPIWEPTVEAGP